MPIFRNSQRNICYIHIPKCGGKSVKNWIENSGFRLHSFYRGGPHQGGVSPQHLTYEELKKAAPTIESMYSFATIRNPYARLYSEYKWQMKEGRLKHADFEKFALHVEKSIKKDITQWDNHWRPQSDFISSSLNTIIKLEEIEEGLKNVASDLRIRGTTVKTINKSKESSWKDNYTPKSRNVVERIYKEDLEKWNYSFD